MPVFIAAILCIALVVIQDIFPGQPWYHQGAYALTLAALISWQWWMVRRYWKYALVVTGATIIGAAGLASSLLSPDPRTIVGGPGESVPITEPAGVLQFPVSRPPLAPILQRPGRSGVAVGLHGRTYLAASILWTQPRTSAYLEVSDAHGARLTITQPTNTSFLSPVLLFRNTASIGGQILPVDSFAVPAAHRSVKAVLFTAAGLARMEKRGSEASPGILFAVEDERGQLIPGAIGLARDGEAIQKGGLILRPSIQAFPDVVITSAPYLPAVILGLFLTGIGVFKSRSRSRSGNPGSGQPG